MRPARLRPAVSVPVGFTTFPGELFPAPRSWVEVVYPDLTYFNEVDKGGHFAAWEEPELFSAELRAGVPVPSQMTVFRRVHMPVASAGGPGGSIGRSAAELRRAAPARSGGPPGATAGRRFGWL